MRMQTPLALGLLAVAACSSTGPSDDYWEEHISSVASVVVPDTVSAGAEFYVTISAYGGFKTSRASRDEVVPTQRGVQITPYDWEYYPEGPKNRALQTLVHVVPLTAGQPGTYQVDVRKAVYTDPPGYAVQTISKEIVVRGSGE